MRWLVLVGLVALWTAAAGYEYCGVYGHWLVIPEAYHPAYCVERPQNISYPQGVGASPWLPSGASIEYNYTRVAALFDIRPNYKDAVVFTRSNIGSDRVTVVFGVNAALKTDGRPVLQYLTPVPPRWLGWFSEFFYQPQRHVSRRYRRRVSDLRLVLRKFGEVHTSAYAGEHEDRPLR